jgi:pilus assembly protein CpaE
MASSDTHRFHGRCNALYIGGTPAIVQELHPLLLHHFPLCSAVQLAASPSPQELSAAFLPSVPKLCILDVAQLPDAVAALIPELLRLDPKLGIVTVLPRDHPGLIMPYLRLGATDFLTSPFTPDQVEAAAQKLLKLFPPGDASPAGRIYCVLPAKGGCGATTVACSLAFEWKRMASSRVLLTDLDPFTGTIGFLLKAKSTFSFMDVLGRAADMDADLWKAMVTDCRGVDVLLSPELSPEGASEMSDASPILDYARCHYPAVISDAGSAIGDWSLSQAALSDSVLLVSTNELTSLQCAQRAIQYLESHGIGHWRIKLILNRFDDRFGVSRELVQDALGMDVFHVLPKDDAAVQRSLMEGKPIARVSRLGKSIAALALSLSGREPARKMSSMAGLRALFTRTSS